MKNKYTKNIASVLKDTGFGILMLCAATIIGWLFHRWGLHETNVVVVYILTVLLISRFTKGYCYGICASVLSLLLFNWFFTEPYFTFKVNDPTYLITFIIMLITSVITSALTTKVKEAADNAKKKEEESSILYQMTNHLTDAEDVETIARVIVKTVSGIFSCLAACICFDENGIPEKSFIQQKSDGSQIRRKLESGSEIKQRIEQLHAPYDIGNEFFDYPIYGRNKILAVLRIPKDCAETMTESKTKLLHSVIESAALALERFQSLKEQSKIKAETEQERYRANLLRAISHDIRTPLSGIMGTSEMLMDMNDDNEQCYKLAKEIHSDADWLYTLVENILNLTKLQDGRVKLNKQPEALEEVIGASLVAMEKWRPDREISVEMPDPVIMVPMEPRLISQVLINLLDNAEKHTPKDKEIKITAEKDEDSKQVIVRVEDRGSGIEENDLPNIFKMFYTSHNKSPDSKQRSMGLGLSICESIIKAHGGKISAQNRKGGGAEFVFTLPLGGDENVCK